MGIKGSLVLRISKRQLKFLDHKEEISLGEFDNHSTLKASGEERNNNLVVKRRTLLRATKNKMLWIDMIANILKGESCSL